MTILPQTIITLQAPWVDVIFDASATYPAGSRQWFAQIRHQFQTKYSLVSDQARRAVAAAGVISRQPEARATDQSRKPEPPTRARSQSHRPEPEARATATKPRGRQTEPLQTEPLEAKNGVVDDKWLYYMVDGRLRRIDYAAVLGRSAILSAAAAMQLGLRFKLATIWVAPNTLLSKIGTSTWVETGLENDLHTPEWDIKNPQYNKSTNLCTFVRGWKRKEHRAEDEDGRVIGLGFAENGEWVFKSCPNPVQLLGTLTYLEDAIKTNISYAAHSVGRKLMELANQKGGRKEWIRPVNILEYPAAVGMAGKLQWKRPFSPEEEKMNMLLAYDKNSQYTAACTHTKLGSGAPEHTGSMEYTDKIPTTGRYFIKLSGESEWDGAALPHPLDGQTEGWYWGYTVKLAAECGYTIEIQDSWVWAEAHTTLRPWAEALWSARCRLNENHPDCDRQRYFSGEARRWAYESIKQIMNASIGLLAHKPDHLEWAGAMNWYRPDWNSLIVDCAKYQMFRRIKQVCDATGKTPVGCETDCLFYCSDNPDHDAAIFGMMDRSGKLGGYKRKWAQNVPVVVAAPLFARMRSIIQVNGAIGKWVKDGR
jgi:hypothetical protein